MEKLRKIIRGFLRDEEGNPYFYHWLNSRYFYELGRIFDQLNEDGFFPKRIEHCKLIGMGCGSGDYFAFFVSKGVKQMVGIDISESRLSLTSKKIECLPADVTVELLKGDMSDMGQCRGDIIFSKGTMLLLDNPEQAVREMIRVTNRRGIIMVSFSEKRAILYWLHRRAPGIKMYTSSSLLSLFNKYGAKCVLKHSMLYFYSPLSLMNPFGLLGSFLAKYCPHCIDILDDFIRFFYRVPSHGMLVFIKQRDLLDGGETIGKSV